jgi:transposase
MPAPNPNNPICPTCGKHTTYNMTLESGARQYRCRRHKPNFTCTDSDRPVGRPPDGEVAMTQVELNQRYRDANREKYRAAEKVRRDNKKST